MAMVLPPPKSWDQAAFEVPTVVENAIVGFPDVFIGSRDQDIVETSLPAPARVQRLMFGAECLDAFRVRRIRFGAWDILANCDPIPARIVDGNDPSLPDFSSRMYDTNTSLMITLENITDRPVQLSLGARCQLLLAA